MINRPNTNAQRLKRHKRVRGKISGTPERPRLNVFRSNANIYACLLYTSLMALELPAGVEIEIKL